MSTLDAAAFPAAMFMGPSYDPLLEEPGDSRSTLTGDRERRVERRLGRLAPGAEDFYLTSKQIMAMRLPPPAYASAVAHCLREIESTLREVLVGSVRSASRRSSESPTVGQQIEGAASRLGLAPEIADAWKGLLGGKTGLPRFAHRRSLDASRPADAELTNLLGRCRRVFDAVLASLGADATDEPLDRTLGRILPGADEFLISAQRFIDAEQLAARSSVAAHCLREAEAIFRRFVAPDTDHQRRSEPACTHSFLSVSELTIASLVSARPRAASSSSSPVGGTVSMLVPSLT